MTRIAIIGSGAIGLSIAYQLSKHNKNIIVIDDQKRGAASIAAAGYLDPFNLDPEWKERGYQSLALYPDFVAEIEKLSGQSVAFDRTGMIYLATSAVNTTNEILSGLEDWDAEKLRKNEPLLAGHFSQALFYKDAAQVEPSLLHAALKIACQKQGVSFIKEIVTGFDRGAHTVTAAHTSVQKIKADIFVIAAGAWSNSLFQNLAIDQPVISPVKGQIVTLNTNIKPNHMLDFKEDGIYIMPRNGNHVTVGATSEDAGFDDTVDQNKIKTLIQKATRLFPNLSQSSILSTHAGFRPFSHSHLFVGASNQYQNVQIASGHYRNGILLSPITAQIIANNLI